MANGYVAFLRAVNVGGHGRVTMEDLRCAFDRMGLERVRTYIQSGNVLFEAPGREREALTREVESYLGKLLGGDVVACLRTLRELEGLVRRDPFAEYRRRRGLKLYVTFLRRPPHAWPRQRASSARDGLEVIARDGLDVLVVRRPVKGRYGYPNLLVEEAYGVPGTTRNWNTVSEILALG